ncbi:MAG TPA: SAM-dependent methyltransferase [Oribacterium sp.]|jgi:tRNA1Val (adenine37-N6)-methyltransferase|nr:SAM-dependent methyltransferase [Oribacterium sp.]
MAERIDDLQCKGYRILQDSDGFCFGMDAVLLANYAAASVIKGNRVLDLGTGTGIIPLLLAAKTEASRIDALEIQSEVADMAQRSVILNHEEDRIFIHHADLREIRRMNFASSMNIVTSNPPYMNAGLKNTTDRKLISRHEVECTLRDVVTAAAFCLKSNGKFFMVHRPNRLTDIMTELRAAKLEPKRMRLVYPFRNAEANLLLVEAVKGAHSELRMEPPLIVYEAPNIYTDEIYDLYGMERPKH